VGKGQEGGDGRNGYGEREIDKDKEQVRKCIERREVGKKRRDRTWGDSNLEDIGGKRKKAKGLEEWQQMKSVGR